MTEPEDFARNGRALIDLQLKLLQQATTAMAASTQRLQEDVDSILHAFAMVPVAANRAIRSAAMTSDTEPGAAPAKAGAAPARKPRRSGEHAR